MDTIDFRSVTQKDVSELFDLFNNLSEEGKRFFHPHPFDRKTLEQIYISKKDSYFVLTIDNKIVGYSMLRFFGYKTPSFGICISSDYENLGYGSIVMEKTIKEAIILGCKEVLLTVHEENSRAIDLFKRYGFKKIQKNPDNREIKMKMKL